MPELSAQLLQFFGSLLAIVALAAVARWLRLGPAPRLADEGEARLAAEAAVSGFAPVEVALDRTGKGAILSDAQGRLLLLRQHGARFAGRVLSRGARAWQEGADLVIDCGERRFGQTRLAIDAPAGWIRAVTEIGNTTHA